MRAAPTMFPCFSRHLWGAPSVDDFRSCWNPRRTGYRQPFLARFGIWALSAYAYLNTTVCYRIDHSLEPVIGFGLSFDKFIDIGVVFLEVYSL